MRYLNLLIMWLIILIVLGGFGALLSLPTLLPPIRKIGQNSERVRLAKSLIFGLLTVVILFAGVTWIDTYVDVFVLEIVRGSTLDHFNHGMLKEVATDRSAVATELWLRWLSPLDRSCYGRQMTICELADTIDSMSYGAMPDVSPGAVALIILPGVVTSAMVWRFSRPVLPSSNEDIEANVKKIFQQISDEEDQS